MTGKRPVLPDAADAGMDSASLQAPEGARQGELWDGAGAEAQPGPAQVRGGEADGAAPALGEILRVARHLSALVEEDGRHRQEPREPELEENVEATEPPDENAAESGEPVEPAVGEASIQEGAKGPAAELTQALRTFRADFGRWVEGERRSRRRWAALAMAAGFPALLMLGVLLEQQFEVIPLHDPTGGWRGHVWDNYGRAIVDCAVEARRTGAEVNCPLVVRRP